MLTTSRLKLFVPVLVILCAALLALPLMVLAQGSGPQAIVNVQHLYQRTGPGPEYIVQGVHGGGAFLPVIGRTPYSSWWQVDTQFGAGWVSDEHVLIRGDASQVPIVTEYGLLAPPDAIVIAYPVPAYQLPNPGSQVIGMAPGEAVYPIHGRSYHPGTETWFWMVQTTAGTVWLEDTEQIAVWGYAMSVPTITTEVAFSLQRAAPVADGLVRPPEATPIPEVPVAPTASEPVAETTAADQEEETPAPPQVVTIADTQLRLLGDCYALPLVNYLLQQSPVRSTALSCTDNATGYNRLLLGQADLSISVNGGCGSATETPIALLVEEDGTGHTLSFCTNTPNQTTSTFVNWVQSPTGAAAIQTYQGLPGSQAPQFAVPLN